MRPAFGGGILLCLVLGGLGTCGAQEEQSPPEPEAVDPVLQQIDEIRKIDATTSDGETRLLKLALDDKSESRLRVAALENLAAAKVATPAVQQGVLSLVSKEVEARTRRAAIFALRKVGIPAKEAVPRLIGVLDDLREPPVIRDDAFGRVPATAAVYVLRDYGPEAREAIPALLWSMNPKNRFRVSQFRVAEALGRIAPEEFPHFAEGEAAIQAMIKLLSSGVPGERRFAAEELLALQYSRRFHGRDFLALSAAAEPALEHNLDHPDRDVRLAVAAALLSRRADEQAAAIFDEAIDSGVDYDRQLIFEWLTKYQLHFDGTRLLYDYMQGQDESIRLKAAVGLAGSEHEEEAFELVRANFDKTGSAAGLGAFRRELLEPLRPRLEEFAKTRSSEGYFASGVLKQRFGVEIEIEQEPTAKVGD